MIKQVSSEFFNSVPLDSGVLVKNWDKEHPDTVTDAMILTATTGDFNIASVPTASNLFDDVNGVPVGSKEGYHVDSMLHTIGVTALNTTLETIKLALGTADIDDTTGSVTPRIGRPKSTDFVHLTWLGNTADGGLVAADLNDALSTAGLTLTTTKNGKGTFPLTIQGFTSIATPNVSPVSYYVFEAETETNTEGGETPAG